MPLTQTKAPQICFITVSYFSPLQIDLSRLLLSAKITKGSILWAMTIITVSRDSWNLQNNLIQAQTVGVKTERQTIVTTCIYKKALRTILEASFDSHTNGENGNKTPGHNSIYMTDERKVSQYGHDITVTFSNFAAAYRYLMVSF